MSKRSSRSFIGIGALILILAAAWMFFVNPEVLKIDDDHMYRSVNEGTLEIYDPETGTWSATEERIEREDVLIDLEGEAAIIRNIYRGFAGGGNVTFSDSTLYAVDRLTRRNVSGAVEKDREGHFMFPPRTQRQDYLFHSPEVLEAPALARYVQDERIGDLDVYVFEYEISPVDKTEFFPDIRLNDAVVTGSHSGRMWVEPVSGLTVRFAHEGENDIIDPETGERSRPFQRWSNAMTEETVTRLTRRAEREKRHIIILTRVVPGAAAGGGAVLLLTGLIGHLARRPRHKAV